MAHNPNQLRPAAIRSGARRLDAPAVQEHDLAHQREPDAEAALLAIGRMVGLGEEIEHLRQHVRVDADARVGDVDDCLTGAVALLPGLAAWWRGTPAARAFGTASL